MGIDFEAWAEIGRWSDAISGVLFIVLSIFVATRRPFRPQNGWFALFSGGWGIWIIVRNVPRNLREQAPLAQGSLYDHTIVEELLMTVGLLMACVGIIALARTFPSRRSIGAWPALIVAIAVFAVAVSSTVTGRLEDGSSWGRIAWEVVFDVLMAGTTYFVTRLAFRHVHEPDGHVRKQLRAVALATALFWAAFAGEFLGSLPGAIRRGDLFGWSVAIQLATAAMAGAWAWAALRRPGPDSGGAMRVVVGIFAMQLAGMLLAVAFPGRPTTDFGHLGVARFIGIAILAYSILRHQLFDIDVRLRTGLSRSTVAAVFIAVFFAVSEFSAAFLTDQTDSTAIGIGVTAVLVFAIAPLQRVADRLASTAMPDAVPLDERSKEDRLDLYRNLAASAWADGELSKSEIRVLDTAREKLGVSSEEALRIERQLAS